MKTPTNITLISLNFYPEGTAIGLYSTQLAQYLEERGIALTVLTAFPYYPEWEIASDYKRKKGYLEEKLGSIRILRYKQYVPKHPTFIKRILHILSFTWGTFWNLFKIKQCDVVISVVPFTTSTLLGYILKKRHKAKHWVHIQDFEFDAAFQSGLREGGEQKGGLLYKLLMQIEKSLFSRADKVSSISHAMVNKLKSKTTTPSYYLPNWIDEKGINPAFAKAHPHLSLPKFKILYSGNIGDKQDWAFFKEFIQALNAEQFEVIVVGAGAKCAEVEQMIQTHPNVHLYPPVPYEQLSDLLCGADAHVLFQKAEVLDTVMPSKILGMMASAKPSIITGHPDSEVATVISESGAGFYSSGSSTEEVINQLEQLVAHPVLAEKMGMRAREYVIAHFSKTPILNSFLEALKAL